MQEMKFFQMLSRNNDVNGNPYRLILVRHSIDGGHPQMLVMYEARSSSPNICHELRKQGMFEIGGFHLAPQEYNDTKKQWRAKGVELILD